MTGWNAFSTPPTQVAQSTAFVVACSEAKLKHAAPAREIYTGYIFVALRTFLEANDHTWFINSAKHGLLRPDKVIKPYQMCSRYNASMMKKHKRGVPLPPLAHPDDFTNNQRIAAKVLKQFDQRIYLMPAKYCEGLPDGLRPFRSLYIGQQHQMANKLAAGDVTLTQLLQRFC